MKKTTLFLALMAALTLSAGWVLADETPSPEAFVPNDVHDFKTVPQGTTIEHAFTLENRGDAPLTITGIHPDCGCTLVENPGTVEPKSKITFTVKLDTNDLTGTQRKMIRILTNDPKNSELYYYLVGKVKPYLNILPKPYIVFNNLLSEKVEKSVYIVTEKEDIDFKVIKAESTLPFLETIVSLLPDDQRFGPYPNKQYLLTFRIKDDAPIGYQRGFVTVHTNLKEQPSKKMAATLMLRPDVMATPFDINLDKIYQSQYSKQRMIWVSDNTKAIPGFKVTNVEADHPFIEHELIPIPDQSKVQVIMKVSPDAPLGPFMGQMKIHTNAPREKDRILIVTYGGDVVKP